MYLLNKLIHCYIFLDNDRIHHHDWNNSLNFLFYRTLEMVCDFLKCSDLNDNKTISDLTSELKIWRIFDAHSWDKTKTNWRPRKQWISLSCSFEEISTGRGVSMLGVEPPTTCGYPLLFLSCFPSDCFFSFNSLFFLIYSLMYFDLSFLLIFCSMI